MTSLKGVARGYGPTNSKPKAYRTIHYLNRSQQRPYAQNYAHARQIAIKKGIKVQHQVVR